MVGLRIRLRLAYTARPFFNRNLIVMEKDAEAKFKDASEAYEALKSADKRAEYDELRKYGQHGQPFQGPPGWQGDRKSVV